MKDGAERCEEAGSSAGDMEVHRHGTICKARKHADRAPPPPIHQLALCIHLWYLHAAKVWSISSWSRLSCSVKCDTACSTCLDSPCSEGIGWLGVTRITSCGT